jgi:predicted nucleic acid-binding protein
MRLLIDTNVILDFLLARGEHGELAKSILELATYDGVSEYVSSSAITDIFYVANKQRHNSMGTQEQVEMLLLIIHVLSVTEREIRDALTLRWNDFEDAVQYVTARNNNVDVIITWNTADYKESAIPALTPAELLRTI